MTKVNVCTECVHCKAKFKGKQNWKNYAEHILAKHPEDTERAAWAHEVLGHNEPTPETQAEVTPEAVVSEVKTPRTKLEGED